MTDDDITAEERRWLDTWDEKRQQIADGTMTEHDVLEWTWRNKVLNAISVTMQRIKRSQAPGRDPRRHDNTWVTVAAERGRKKEDLSPLALRALAYVYEKLSARGHDFIVDWMATASGVVVVSINVRNLRDYMERKQAPE